MKRFLLSIVLCISPGLNCLGANTLNQNLVTTVPSAINITATGTNTSGTINIDTGANSGVSSQFRIQTNGDDDCYDFVLQANVKTTGGINTNAYGQKGSTPYIVFGNNNSTYYPTVGAINNIANAIQGNNPNAIAYPITSSVTNLSSISLATSSTYGGYYYKVLTGENSDGYVNQSVNTSPIANTYFYGEDKPGTYQVILTMSAFRKP